MHFDLSNLSSYLYLSLSFTLTAVELLHRLLRLAFPVELGVRKQSFHATLRAKAGKNDDTEDRPSPSPGGICVQVDCYIEQDW